MTPGTTIGRYVVKRKLAEGGMAEILLCAVRGPEGFEKEVVLKRIRSHFAADAGFVRMFVDEARVVSRLHHPNIVQVFDFDQHEDTYYLAMEYVRGKSLWDLRKRCREQGMPVPPVLSSFMAAEVARALDHAHGLSENGKRLGVVHRDVTPHNVLLSFDGAVKLADFGIVKSNAGLTAPGTLKGKLAYMSPEQARGERVDPRTDVFALGIVLWELLTGGRLFEGGNEIAILRAVQQSTIVPAIRLNPDVPSALSDVVDRALQRDAGARFQSAAELERALREVLLAHARTVEDTDAGAFLRRMFPEDATPAGSLQVNPLREQPTAPGRGEARAATPRGRSPAVQVPGPGARAASLLAAEESPTLVVRPLEQSIEPSRLTAAPQLGMRQALGVGAAAVMAGAALAAAVGLWQGRGRGDGGPGPGRPPSLSAIPPTVQPPSGGALAEAPAAGQAPAPVGEPVRGPAESGREPGAQAALPQARPDATGTDGGQPAREVMAGQPSPPAGASSPRVAGAPMPSRAVGGAGKSAPVTAAPGRDQNAAAGSPARTAPAQPLAGEPGKIQLRVIPWAQAWLDGQPLGEVGPQREISAAAGDHQLRLEHPRGTRQLSVHVESGAVTALALDMLAP